MDELVGITTLVGMKSTPQLPPSRLHLRPGGIIWQAQDMEGVHFFGFQFLARGPQVLENILSSRPRSHHTE